MKLWQGRFEKENTKVMQRANHSLPVDIALLPFDVELNRIWSEELNRIGILSGDELRAVHGALETVLAEYNEGALSAELNDEDVHTLVERRVTEIAGEAGQKIHTGRSRNEQVVTDVLLFLRHALPNIHDLLGSTVSELVASAEQQMTTPLPGFTHLQHAQPILLSHYLLSLAWSLKSDADELSNMMETSLAYCPLGSGAFAGTTFPIDRVTVARDLGFSAPTQNSIEAVSSRDAFLSTAFSMTKIMLTLSRYSEDLIIWSSPEFGFIELDESVSTGSSMMPQKKNPDSLELIRGKSARVVGDLQTLLTLVKGLPLTYAKDLQEDKPPLFDAIEQTSVSLQLFSEVVKTARWNTENMFSKIDDFLYATDIADDLTQKGLPFRKAHEVVAKLVRDAVSNKRSLSSYTASELAIFSDKFTDDLKTYTDPDRSVALRNIKGGTGPDSVDDQLVILKDWLSLDQ